MMSINAQAEFNPESFAQELAIIKKNNNLASIAVAVVSDGNVLFKETSGLTDVNGNKKIDGDTKFQIASLSKAFLGSLLAILVDQQQLNWSQIVSLAVKEFQISNPTYNQQLSFHHIAAMQSGLPAYAGKEEIKNASNRQEILKIFNQIDSLNAPGEHFTYQYALLSVLEEIVKRKSGLEWEKFLQRKIIEPLKLINTGIDITQANLDNVAKPLDEHNQLIDFESFKVNSAAGLYSSLNDMIRWVQFHLRDGTIGNKAIISKTEINNMRKSFTPIVASDHLLEEDGNITERAYGYFWQNYRYGSNNKFRVIEHTGNCRGASAIISFVPSKKIGIIVLINKFSVATEQIRSKFLQQLN